MTTEAPSAASIADRLVRLSKERRLDHSFVLVRYGIERLLWRISSSAFADDFVLKGANLFAVWWEDDRRPTRDLDLLGQGTPDPARLAGIFRALCAQDTSLRDGLVFDPATVVAERIRAEEEYEGVRVRLRATLLRTRIDVQVDIGFGDAVTPLPERKPFPTLLGGVAPVLRVYPLETAFAEKLQALVELGVRNSRLKDYHDMLAILESKSTGDDLQAQAILATFRRRRTEIPSEVPYGLSEAFAEDPVKVRQWKAFQARLGTADPRSLPEIVHRLRQHVLPIFERIRTQESAASRPFVEGPEEL